jgi:membrane associated rhomboid family serine protease
VIRPEAVRVAPGGLGGSFALLTVSPRGHGNSRARAPAYATWALIALTITVYLIQITADETRASEIVLRYGVTPEIFSGDDRPFGGFPPLLTPLTAMFLHGSWDHLAGNIIYLWVFGDDIEEALGPFRFVLFYLVCGVCGALGYIAMDSQATLPLLGASGCVSGLLAAYLMLKPCEPVAITLPRLDVRLATYWAVGGWILLQLFQFLWHADEETFATLAQPGGVIGGAIAFWLLCPRGIELFKCLPSRNDGSGEAS